MTDDPEIDYFSGLDLGQAADYSALIIVQRERRIVIPFRDPTTLFRVRHIYRWPLGTSYTRIVAELKAMFAAPPLTGSVLAIDRTGVGRGVSDMVRDSDIRATCRAYTITAGSKPGPGTVPKKELVAAVQVPLQERRVKFADKLELTATLQSELEHFKVKVTADRNETYEAWRERDHDDFVLALALALYAGRTTTAAFATAEILNQPTNQTGWSKPWWSR